jgi:Holliday junction resolvase RusA-like endonuclease
MTKIKILDYPWPPSINSSYPTNRHGRRFTGPKLKAFKKQCEIWDKTHGSINPEIEALRKIIALDKFYVDIKIIFSVPSQDIWTQKFTVKKNDADNRIKALFDGLSTTLGIDDRYFSISLCTKAFNNEGEYKTILVIDYKPIRHESELIKEHL